MQLRTAKTAIVPIIFDPATLLLVRRSCRMLHSGPISSLNSRSGALDRHMGAHTNDSKWKKANHMHIDTQILPSKVPVQRIHPINAGNAVTSCEVREQQARGKLLDCATAQRLLAHAWLLGHLNES